MADGPKHSSIFSDIFKNVADSIVNSIKEQAKNFIVGAAIDSINTMGDAVKDGITKGVYKDGKVPKQFQQRSSGGYGRYLSSNDEEDYSSYYYSPKSSSSYKTATTSTESAVNVRVIPFDTKEDAIRMIDRIIEKIDNSSNNACTVGYLYEMQTPKINSSGMMFWKYGWNASDKENFDTKQILDPNNKYYRKWIMVLPKPHVVIYN